MEKQNTHIDIEKEKGSDKSDVLFVDRNRYIGRSYLGIIEFHKDREHTSIAIDQNETALEIRFDISTLTCLFKNNICYEAIEMYDTDTLSKITKELS